MGVKKYKPKRTPKLLEERTVRVVAEARKTIERGKNAIRGAEDLVTKSKQIVEEIRRLRSVRTRSKDGESAQMPGAECQREV